MQKKQTSVTFGLIVPRFEDIFHSYYAGEVIKGVSLAASRLQVDVLVHITDRFDHRAWLDRSLLDRARISGIIFADIDNDLKPVRQTIKAGIPTIVLNNFLKDPVNCIAIDNERITREAIKLLVNAGHKRIATIAGDLSTQAGQMRLSGYEKALKEAKIKVPDGYAQRGDFLRTPARLAAIKLLKMQNRPTAVFAASDVMALELMDVAREEGIKVPEELSVIGFDDNPLNRHSPVALTTVSQPLIEMGRLGVEQLYQIASGRVKAPVKIILPAKVELRDTIAKLKAGAKV